MRVLLMLNFKLAEDGGGNSSRKYVNESRRTCRFAAGVYLYKSIRPQVSVVYITIIPARVGYNHFISNKGKWNNCFSKFSNRVLPPIFISTILQSGKFLNLAHYFSYDVKFRLLAHSRVF